MININMTANKTYFIVNSVNKPVKNSKTSLPAIFWKKLEINEWTFTLSLFTIATSIIVVKLFAYYGNIFTWSPNNILQLFSEFKKLYEEIIPMVQLPMLQKYTWIMKVLMTGFAMMVFSCYIIYKDSSIPGVNPPFPFSPSKRMKPETSRIQSNYIAVILIVIRWLRSLLNYLAKTNILYWMRYLICSRFRM
ncbi:uncharacterized protein [Prorops nasuta]|uniref:uncharacterized protein n=1 Tax=Prorops nasuta TaxID=863751 RepID=UPI0034CF04EC